LFFPFVTALVVIVLALFLPFPLKVRDKVFEVVAKTWGKAGLLLSNTKLEIENIENVPSKPPYMIVFNHGSNFDIFALFLLPQAYRAVMKKEILYIPFFGLIAVLYGHIPIDRKNLRRAKHALEKVKHKFKRYPIFMAITGTRVKNKDFMKKKLKKGPVITAIQNSIPMLPVTVLNADKVHLRGFRPLTPGLTIKLVVHPIIPVDKYSLENRNEVLSLLKEIIGKPIEEEKISGGDRWQETVSVKQDVSST
jgi:1-acyl-sn-glycerol-3-phosphate acyltransferase